MSRRRKVAALVCEGPSDFEIFRAIVQEVWPEIEEVLPLQPEIDAEGYAVGQSGWPGVRKWCLDNAGRLDNVIDPGIGPRLDLLVIALDADIAVQAGISDAPIHGSAYDTGRLCATVKGWLRPAGGRTAIPPEVVISIPAMATETWVIASLYAAEKNPEAIADPTRYLVDNDQLAWDPLRKRKARKPPPVYRRFAAQITGKLARVRKRCTEAERTCRKIELRRDATGT